MSHTGEFLQNPIELQVRFRQRWIYYDANNEQNGRRPEHEFWGRDVWPGPYRAAVSV
jgi:hypothetical protein